MSVAIPTPDARASLRERWLAITVAATVGMLTRTWYASRPLWFDEAYSVVMASGPALEIPQVQATYDIHPPLFSLLLHGWMVVTPGDDAWLRLFSVLLTYATVAVLTLIAWQWRGWPLALLVLTLGLCAPILTVVAQEVRHYALLSPVSALVLVPLVPILERRGRPRHYALLGVAGLACLFTQYIGGFYLGVVLTLAFLLAPTAAIRGRLLMTVALIALIFAPWVSTVLEQMRMEHALFADRIPASRNPIRLAVELAALWTGSAGASARPLGLLYAAGLIGVAGWRFSRWRSRGADGLRGPRDRVEALVVLAWLLGPILYIGLVLVVGLRITAVTYLLSFGQLAVVLIALAITDLPNRWQGLALIAAVGLLATASFDKGVLGQRQVDRWDLAARCFEQYVHRDHPVIFSNGIVREMLGRYAPRASMSFANPAPYVYARNERQGVNGEEIRAHVADRPVAWVLNAYSALGPATVATLPAYAAEAPMRCGPVEFVRLTRR
jgi:uncharacterized membrane protein